MYLPKVGVYDLIEDDIVWQSWLIDHIMKPLLLRTVFFRSTTFISGIMGSV
jgi:hypothetical protein